MNSSSQRILDYIKKYAATSPDAPVLLVPGKPSLSYARLFGFIQETKRDLLHIGIRKEHRIAVVLPNTAAHTVAFFVITDIATCVPLNPKYSLDEFKQYFSLFAINYVLLQEGETPFAKEAAEKLRIPLVILTPTISGPAGLFTLLTKSPPPEEQIAAHSSAGNQNIAFISHTSGTTNQPKIVPRTHTNVCFIAEWRARAFDLTSQDRTLIVSPIFRSSTLNTILATVAVGGSFVLCPGGFDLPAFLAAFAEMSPTWFGAPPAILQSIVDHAEKNGRPQLHSSLRFVRSNGAPLSTVLRKRLENLFGVRVICSYGMTEAGTIASDYQAPKGSKEGSVGVSVGCEIAIINEKGERLPVGSCGEITVRGPNVVTCYENNPEANQASFSNGWFRTGDLGRLDEDGYLFIIGRVKELINRGGEKVSPYEVEKAILQHPDILDAAVFPLPHSEYGEAVATMVVLKPTVDLPLRELRRFLTDKISLFKMPTQLFTVAEIPVTASGKVQRSTLSHYIDNLKADNDVGTANGLSLIPPQTDTEKKLAKLWKEILRVGEIATDDDFFELGGDSLSLYRLYTEIEHQWHIQIPLTRLFKSKTLSQLARLIDQGTLSPAASPRIMPIQKDGDKTPLFCFHYATGDVLPFRNLAFHLGNDQPVYGLQFIIPKLKTVSIPEMAAIYIHDIRNIQPEGPYYLLGHSYGGKIAYEVANQLTQMNQPIALLALLDTLTTHSIKDKKNKKKSAQRIEQLRGIQKDKRASFLWSKIKRELSRIVSQFHSLINRYFVDSPEKNQRILEKTSRKYEFKPFPGEVIFFQPENPSSASEASVKRWSELVGSLRVVKVQGEHGAMISEPYVAYLAEKLKKYLPQADSH